MAKASLPTKKKKSVATENRRMRLAQTPPQAGLVAKY
jgi:hypothetical protein